MTEKCFDIGTIQAFLDGELAADQSELMARHISVCDDCAFLMAEAEEETAFAFSALEQEFNTLVPTQRLWTKINDSIEKERKSFWKPIFAFVLQPSTAAFASLVFVFAVVVALLSLKPDGSTNYMARNDENKQNPASVISKSESPNAIVPSIAPAEKNVEIVNLKQNKPEYRTVKTSYIEVKNNPASGIPSIKKSENSTPASGENVSGEESYVKTITTLTETVSNRKDEVLNPSARFAFERDMAVTDDAIKRMKKEVRRNPKNEAAKQVLRTSYQNKIDLLNSVAEKTELMASLK